MDRTINCKTKSLLIWLSWVLILFFIMYQALLQCTPSIMIANLMQDLKVSLLQVGFLSSSFYITYLICQIPAGVLLDYIGPKKMIPIMIFIVGVSCLIFENASSANTVVLSRLIMGIACSPGIVGGFFVASRYLPKSLFPLLAGVIETMGTLGGAVGEVALSHSVNSYGWRQTMFFCAIFAFALAILGFIFLRNLPNSKDSIDNRNKIDESSFIDDLKTMLTSSQIWINIFYCGLMYCIIVSFAQLWTIPYIEHRYSLNTQQAAMPTSMIFIGASVGLIFFGGLVSKIKRYKTIMCFCSLICLLDLCVILYTQNISLHVMYLLFFVLGFFCTSYAIPFSVVKILTPPKAHGTAMGFTNMLCVIPGALVLQPLIPALLTFVSKAHHTSMSSLKASDYVISLSTITICIFIGVILSFFMKDEY